MHRLLLIISGIATFAVLFVAPAAADDMENCRTTRSADRIAACTRAIASRKFKGEDLAFLYANRGRAYELDGNYDRAIENYTEALRIRPKDNVFADDSIYVMRGVTFWYKGEHDRAIADFNQALRAYPNSPIRNREAYHWRAHMYELKGDLDRAIADFGEVIKTDQKWLNPYYRRGVLHHRKGDFDRAIADYTDEIRLNSKHTPSFVARGLAYEKKGDAAKAKEDFTAALGLPSEKHENEYTYDIAQRRLQALEQVASAPAKTSPPPAAAPAPQPQSKTASTGADDAKKCEDLRGDARIAACTRAIQKEPKEDIHYFRRGLGYHFDKKDYDRAIADFSEAIRLKPLFSPYYDNRGISYYEKRDYDRAIADLNEAIRLDLKDTRALTYRALSFKAKGETERAVADLRRALELDKDDYTAREVLAELEAAGKVAKVPATPAAPAPQPQGKTSSTGTDDTKKCEDYKLVGDEKIAACTSAIKSDPKEYGNYYRRGLAYHFDKKDYDRAIADFSEAIRLSPGSYASYNHRGMSYYEKREYDRAIADLSEAIRLDPKYALAFTYRGLSFKAKGDMDRAAADVRRAVELDPKDSSAREALAEIEAASKVAKAPAPPAAPAPPKKEAVATPPPPAPAPPPVASPPPSAPPPVVQKPEPKVAVAPAPPKAEPAATPPPVSAPATPEVRVALVIGNGNYRAVGKLQNPSKDAATVAAGLRKVGFKTVQLTSDLSREGMIAALRTFEREAEKADWAVVYFAGHGIEVAGVNYLIPVDAQLKADKDVHDEAVPLDRVLSAIESAKKLKLVILDACRDNPFVATMKRSIASRSIGRGLAQIEPESGVLVAYAAKHGQVALDGEGGNSPFVTALVKRLDTPGLDVSLLFRLVRDDVLTATARKQEPYVYGSLPGELLSFRPK